MSGIFENGVSQMLSRSVYANPDGITMKVKSSHKTFLRALIHLILIIMMMCDTSIGQDSPLLEIGFS
jgi:hypothetical protein